MPTTLRDYPFKISYSARDDRLHDFYIPALKASHCYDRMAGYFTSHALAIAAAGIAHLIANGGQMRLLVGGQLAREDVEAIRAGVTLQDMLAARYGKALPDPATLEDDLLRERLAALAWMVATDRLQIRVVLQEGKEGLPLAVEDSAGYFHPKLGVFTDVSENQLAFNGSINDSTAAWKHNYEQFLVYPSWGELSPNPWLQEIKDDFHAQWTGEKTGWITLPIPDAARDRLLRYTPTALPIRDPLERDAHAIQEKVEKIVTRPALRREQLIVQFLRDAPHLIGATSLGAATSALMPWPHQQSVSQAAIMQYAQRYLLADEVGLGKTIEAGLILRQLYLSGVVKRALILAPKSVLRQWQEELYEKFTLNVPIYDGTIFRDYHGSEIAATGSNPWDKLPLALASSQLVKRKDRQATLVAAQPWDLVLVDEAHHARRKDFLSMNRFRPNRLLELLLALQTRTAGLLLMTATPMQVHPIEVWDLTRLLGLGGAWGSATGHNFLRFFQELRKPVEEADWHLVFRLVRDEVERAGLDPEFKRMAEQQLGPVEWSRVQQLLTDRDPSRLLHRLSDPSRTIAIQMARQHTPLRRLVFRNTRALLRRYRAEGLLDASVPERVPRLVWIPMRREERNLYDRIEEYISNFYQKYETERKGLGFVMTVYRRRLTSSFYAVRKSLERRLEFLVGQRADSLEEEDIEEDALNFDIEETLDEENRALYRDEIEYVEDFLHQLRQLTERDSKVEQLLGDLRDIFRLRDTVLVFTQYTDTMDYLREQLVSVYGTQVACYSGRGGERWDGVMWVEATKEEIKNAFRQGEKIKILLATEAASEGLNLQTCGVLINYDMPWNPMRVEQRIGRIDRIGQRYEQIWIRNYFYEKTVEARVYRALEDRIDWFETVVGRLQPILSHVGRAIEQLVMIPAQQRQEALDQTVAQLRAELDEASAELDLDEWVAQEALGELPRAPVSLTTLGEELPTLPTLQRYFRPHEQIEAALWLRLEEHEHAVTFDPECYDRYPDTLELLTYGNPLLARLLDLIPAPVASESGPFLRLSTAAPLPRVAYYLLANDSPQPIHHFSEYKARLNRTVVQEAWTEQHIDDARADFVQALQDEWQTIQEAKATLRASQQSALEAEVRTLLLQAALIEIAIGQQPELWMEDAYPLSFDQAAIVGLKRHGPPFAPALRVLDISPLQPAKDDPFFLTIQHSTPEQLKRQFSQVEQKLRTVLSRLVILQRTPEEHSSRPQVQMSLYK